MSTRAELLQRLDAVEARLASRSTGPAREGALTDPDLGTGERWDAGQVWAHTAEFIPYWIEQAQLVLSSYEDEPVPFGRTQSDPGRLAAIARDRDQPVTVLWTETHSEIESLRRFIESLDDAAWSARGLHPMRGVQEMDHILEEFLVGHLEEHADQLDALARSQEDRG